MFYIGLKSVPPSEKTTFVKSSKWYKFMRWTAKYTRKYAINGHISTKSMRGACIENGCFVRGNFELKFPEKHKEKRESEYIIVLS